MDLLLSIRNEYISLIRDGVKTYEFRKKILKKTVNYIYVYASKKEKR